MRSKEQHHTYRSAQGDFELWLPPGAGLKRDESAPADESYFYWSPPTRAGTFSVLLQATPGRTPDGLLALEQELGAEVSVERNEAIERDDGPAHLLRFSTVAERPRELVEDPVSGEITVIGPSVIERRAEYLFWFVGEHSISAGYRVDAAASEEIREAFKRMLDSFRMLGER